MLLQIAAKRPPMLRRQTQIFIHVKADDACPVDPLAGHKDGQELVLTGSRREYDASPPSGRLTIENGFANTQRPASRTLPDAAGSYT